jgi:hypothetical protein
MTLFWRGLGFLVPLIFLGSLGIGSAVMGHSYFGAHGWPKLLTAVIAAITTALLGERLNRNKPEGHTHAFFLLNMENWALVFVGLGIWMAVN